MSVCLEIIRLAALMFAATCSGVGHSSFLTGKQLGRSRAGQVAVDSWTAQLNAVVEHIHKVPRCYLIRAETRSGSAPRKIHCGTRSSLL
jgi:hypothetical protein